MKKMKRYRNCIKKINDCECCSLSSNGLDCYNNPVNQIAYYRKKAKMTQAELAEASGLSLSLIRKLETGDRSAANLALANAIALAKALKLKRVEDLLPQSEEE